MLLGITHVMLAYQFDDAVATFGLHIDVKLQEKRNGKYRYQLDKLLRDPDDRPVKRTVSRDDLITMAAWGGGKVEYVDG